MTRSEDEYYKLVRGSKCGGGGNVQALKKFVNNNNICYLNAIANLLLHSELFNLLKFEEHNIIKTFVTTCLDKKDTLNLSTRGL